MNFYSDVGAVEDVCAAAKALGAKLVVVDTLARAIAEGDENTADDMGAPIAVLDRVREATGAHVMLIHHTGKDEARGIRGHSSLNGAADMTLHVTKDGDEVTTTTTTTMVVVVVVDEVQGIAKKRSREKLAANQQMWLEEIRSFIAETNPIPVAPRPDMRRERAVTRHDLMVNFRARKLLGVTPILPDGRNAPSGFSNSERQRMHRILIALKAKKKLAFTDKLVWLL